MEYAIDFTSRSCSKNRSELFTRLHGDAKSAALTEHPSPEIKRNRRVKKQKVKRNQNEANETGKVTLAICSFSCSHLLRFKIPQWFFFVFARVSYIWLINKRLLVFTHGETTSDWVNSITFTDTATQPAVIGRNGTPPRTFSLISVFICYFFSCRFGLVMFSMCVPVYPPFGLVWMTEGGPRTIYKLIVSSLKSITARRCGGRGVAFPIKSDKSLPVSPHSLSSTQWMTCLWE